MSIKREYIVSHIITDYIFLWANQLTTGIHGPCDRTLYVHTYSTCLASRQLTTGIH